MCRFSFAQAFVCFVYKTNKLFVGIGCNGNFTYTHTHNRFVLTRTQDRPAKQIHTYTAARDWRCFSLWLHSSVGLPRWWEENRLTGARREMYAAESGFSTWQYLFTMLAFERYGNKGTHIHAQSHTLAVPISLGAASVCEANEGRTREEANSRFGIIRAHRVWTGKMGAFNAMPATVDVRFGSHKPELCTSWNVLLQHVKQWSVMATQMNLCENRNNKIFVAGLCFQICIYSISYCSHCFIVHILIEWFYEHIVSVCVFRGTVRSAHWCLGHDCHIRRLAWSPRQFSWTIHLWVLSSEWKDLTK